MRTETVTCACCQAGCCPSLPSTLCLSWSYAGSEQTPVTLTYYGSRYWTDSVSITCTGNSDAMEFRFSRGSGSGTAGCVLEFSCDGGATWITATLSGTATSTCSPLFLNYTGSFPETCHCASGDFVGTITPCHSDCATESTQIQSDPGYAGHLKATISGGTGDCACLNGSVTLPGTAWDVQGWLGTLFPGCGGLLFKNGVVLAPSATWVEIQFVCNNNTVGGVTTADWFVILGLGDGGQFQDIPSPTFGGCSLVYDAGTSYTTSPPDFVCTYVLEDCRPASGTSDTYTHDACLNSLTIEVTE